MKTLRLTVFTIATLVISSCAVGKKVNYNSIKMDLFAVKAKSIDIVLLDHREAVVDGSRKPSFCGYMRSGVGIAYPVSTSSKKSFIDDIGNNIVSSLNKFNVKATLIPSNFEQSEETAKQNLLLVGGDKKMLFVFEEFHTDGYGIQYLHYNFDISVFDKDNNLIMYKKYYDKEKLGGNVAFGAGGFKKYMPEKVMEFFEGIFNDQEILNALNK